MTIFSQFVGTDVEMERMEVVELKDHPFFVAVQYHPEYLSRPMRPSPPYLGLVLAATGKLQTFLAKVRFFQCMKSSVAKTAWHTVIIMTMSKSCHELSLNLSNPTYSCLKKTFIVLSTLHTKYRTCQPPSPYY